jgi:hypothetical protein
VGLDPPTLKLLSSLLHRLAEAQAPRLILSLKPDEHIPSWITHMAFLTRRFEVDSMGPREDVTEGIRQRYVKINGVQEKHKIIEGSTDAANSPVSRSGKGGNLALKWTSNAGQSPVATDDEREIAQVWRHLYSHQPAKNMNAMTRGESANYLRERNETLREKELPPRGSTAALEKPEFITENTITRHPNERRLVISRDGYTPVSFPRNPPGEPLIEMNGVKVQYGEKAVLGDWKQEHNGTERQGLWWTVSRGQRWGVFGPNGMFSMHQYCEHETKSTQDLERQP